MAYITNSTAAAPKGHGIIAGAQRLLVAYGHGLHRFFAAFGQALASYAELHSRVGEIERLNNMTDVQLERLGVRRDGIVQYVFRDSFYI
jgi:hypothetical protein